MIEAGGCQRGRLEVDAIGGAVDPRYPADALSLTTMRAVLLLAFLASSVHAQVADPADVSSIDAIMSSVYEVISGPSDEERDWDRFRSMMHPEARLIPTGTRDGVTAANVMSVEDYVVLATRTFRDGPIFQGKGFYEVESARRVERYGSIAHVWSTYESRLDPSEEPFARGINSFQLMWDGQRWHVMTIFWHQETEDTPIPLPYLPE